MANYRKKPVEIEAVEWKGSNLFEVTTFIEGNRPDISSDKALSVWESYEDLVSTYGLSIKTLEGVMSASVGDYIIKGVQGEFYPCKPDIFLMTYDKV